MVARGWFAFLGGPMAWVLHLNLSYLLLTVGCNVGWRGTDAAILLLTLLFALIALFSGMTARKAWRDARDNVFMTVGMTSAGLFLFLIVLTGIAPLFVPTCSMTVP